MGMTNADLAHFAFCAYHTASGGLGHDGQPIPEWEDLPRSARQAWEATAAAVTLTAEAEPEECALRNALAWAAAALEALGAIEKALDVIPDRCFYHEDKTEPVPGWIRRESCCEIGRPAQRRKRAHQALADLRRVLGV
ncbi:hypothetical protein ACWENQ_44935 [Nonomuraea sp. NPDC004354]